MNVVQARMALAALGWSWDRLAEEAGISRADAARFMAGEGGKAVEAMRKAFEHQGIHFLMSGPHKGAVVPAPPAAIKDESGWNPLVPR